MTIIVSLSSVICHSTTGLPNYLEFRFTCIVDPHGGHKPQTRKQMKTGDGIKNLARTIVDCNARRGVAPGDLSSIGAQQMIEKSISEYTPAKHRALIAMCCCVSKHPFNIP